ncbi:HIT family protein [Streptomyces sp. NPDC102473]|uniref:HIT family protein n=1 Tax=Streptomyces sp. NPDC102473 TaxID=3366180 RepID=UPI0038018B56
MTMEPEVTNASASICDFCSIIAGESAAEVIYETASTISFLPLNPATYGHTLVVPKNHVRDIWEINLEAANELMAATLQVAHGIRLALKPEGLNLINSSGAVATQTIFHLHIHLVPRWENDRVGKIWPPDRPLPEAVREELAEGMREGIETARRSRLPSQ